MGLSASGLATGLDINSMVNQLVQAERAPRQKSIDNKLAEVETHISAYGRLKESLDSMKQLMSDFRSDGNFAARKTTTSDEDTLTGEASKDAAPGNYSIEVLKLASAHKLVSSPFAENQVFGAGKLEISLGNRSMSIDVTDPNAKLEDVVTAINSAPSNPGVQASLIQDENGTRLTFSSDKQGDKNHIKVSVNAGIGSPYQQLVFDAGAVSNPMQQMQAASDAQIRIDGLVVANSSTNTFSDVIKGVDLTVENLTVNKPVKFNVDFDKEAVKGALKKFVDAYNGYYELSKNLSRYDQENQQAAPLTGDSTLRSATSQLRRLFASPLEDVTSSFKTLSEIGISTTREGNLEIDDDMLSKQLQQNFPDFQAFFAGPDGFAKKLEDVIHNFTGYSGSIQNRENTLTETRRRLNDEQETLDRRMKQLESQTLDRFRAMESAVSKMQSQLGAMMSMMPGGQ